MRVKTSKALMIATVLSALPVMGFAMCGGQKHQTMSCETGMVWDVQTQACVPQVSS